MNQKEFKSAVQKALWYEKYYYYFFSLGVIGVGIFLLTKAVISIISVKETFDIIAIVVGSLFFFFTGVTSLRLLTNKYKIREFICDLSEKEKERIIKETVKEFHILPVKKDRTFWTFTYRPNWWSNGYRGFFSISDIGILVSITGRMSTRGGLFDLGQTNRLRNEIYLLIQQKIDFG